MKIVPKHLNFQGDVTSPFRTSIAFRFLLLLSYYYLTDFSNSLFKLLFCKKITVIIINGCKAAGILDVLHNYKYRISIVYYNEMKSVHNYIINNRWIIIKIEMVLHCVSL